MEVLQRSRETTELRSGRQLSQDKMATPSGQHHQPAVPPSIVLTYPRDPGFFYGTGDVDVDDWLTMYERVSRHNNWGPTIMLANIVLYLKGTALTWFDTNEHDLTSWDICKERLKRVFGNPLGRQLAAKQELSTRAQTAKEPYLAYIQDVLSLCAKVDSTMSESDKIGHILKGIADDAFNLLVIKNCSTVDEVLAECRRFEEAKCRRIIQNFTRLPNTAATSSCESSPPPSSPPPLRDTTSPENVVRIVRRELEAMAPPTFVSPADHATPTISLIQTVVRQELDNRGLGSLCSLSRPCNYDLPPPSAPRARYMPPRYRNPDEWRTPDDKPICFACHRVGHISRYCPSRWPPRPSSSFYNHQRPMTFRPFVPRRTQDATDSRPPVEQPLDRRSRSPSPRRRLSASPQPRRFPSPPYPGRPIPEN